MNYYTAFIENLQRKGSEKMKKYEVPTLEVIKFDQRDIISASGEPNPGNVNDGSTCSPMNLPCHSQEGNQPAC